MPCELCDDLYIRKNAWISLYLTFFIVVRSAEVENLMTSVERVLEYSDLEQDAPRDLDTDKRYFPACLKLRETRAEFFWFLMTAVLWAIGRRKGLCSLITSACAIAPGCHWCSMMWWPILSRATRSGS